MCYYIEVMNDYQFKNLYSNENHLHLTKKVRAI